MQGDHFIAVGRRSSSGAYQTSAVERISSMYFWNSSWFSVMRFQ
ncbi:MAG: hypothetical protein ACLR5S_00825 [Ruminococcus sp.]